jgi:tRNA 2-thiouridine synthesizing protein E
VNAAVDAEGFLRDLGDWNEAVAEEIARAAGVELTDAHWAVIRTLRAFYQRTGVAPAMRPLVKLVRETLGDACGSSVYLLGLFPGNPAKLAARIAGLPRPTNCL